MLNGYQGSHGLDLMFYIHRYLLSVICNDICNRRGHLNAYTSQNEVP